MHKCDFCQKDSQCSGVQRSECLVRDYLYFKPERTSSDDVGEITQLILQYGRCDEPRKLAEFLVRNGIGRR